MPVYMVIEIKVLNPELYARYVEKVPDIIKKHGGRYLVRGGEVTPMFGNWKPERIILLEFDNPEKLRNCFNSEEYLELAPFRENSTITKAILVNGYSSPE